MFKKIALYTAATASAASLPFAAMAAAEPTPVADILDLLDLDGIYDGTLSIYAVVAGVALMGIVFMLAFRALRRGS